MKKLILILLAAVAVISLSCSPKPAAGIEPGKRDGVIAYYFHGSMRCPTCHKLEEYSKEAIENNFKDEIAAGKLEFKEVNVETRGNERFVNDYQLYTKALVLSSVKDGKEIKWKNLDKIWELVGNKEKFIDYVKAGVTDFLKEVE